MMVNFMMAVNRYCADCMKNGEFLPLHFVMMNIHTGMWMCPKTECIFPMNNEQMQDYIEEDMTTEKVLQLAKLGRRRNRGGIKNIGEVTKESLRKLKNVNSSRKSVKSDPSSTTTNTTSSSYTNSTTIYDESTTVDDDDEDDDDVSTISSCTSAVTLSSGISKKAIQYPLWENTSLLCWLDAALAMLVLNTSMIELLAGESTESLIGHLFTEYKKVLISYNTYFDFNVVKKQLDRMRTNILKFLQPKLLANYGDEDSPLVSLPLVLRTSQKLSENLEINYKCIFKCDSCGFERTDGFNKIIMTLPNTSVDLDFNNNIYFSRGCYKCFTDHQKTRYQIEKYPTVMFVHFPQGVQSRKCWKDFNFKSPDGEEYIVTQIVQYLNKKRHFISWSYDFEEKLWLEADDLKEPVCHHKFRRPKCRPQEVHIVIWERKSVLQNRTHSTKKYLDELNTPDSLSVHKGSSSSVGGVSNSTTNTPDGLPQSDDYRLFSRDSSRPSSLSSFDNISTSSYGVKPFTPSTNPFRPLKNVVQKGLRNTPRYEPYIPRKLKEEMKQNMATASKSRDTASGYAIDRTDSFNTNRCAYSVDNISSAMDYLGPDKRERKQDGTPNSEVSLDFLKGVLSGVSEDLLDSVDDKGKSTTKSPKKRRKSKTNDFLTEDSLDDLFGLF